MEGENLFDSGFLFCPTFAGSYFFCVRLLLTIVDL